MPTASTAARPQSSEGSHWYRANGEPCYEVPYADPSKGMRETTLGDARKLGLLPSVTTILRVLDKPALEAYKIEMAVLSAVTTPRNPGEELDAFIQRVMHVEKIQDQEAEKARDLGIRIHDALSRLGEIWPDEMAVYCMPVRDHVNKLGNVIATEKILVGAGFAGKTDLIVRNEGVFTVIDFKSTKKLPKESYREHRLQLAAYASAFGQTGADRIQTGNIYISTTEPGKTCLCLHDDWQETFEHGFKPLLKLWHWINDYNPTIAPHPAPKTAVTALPEAKTVNP
jgi:hypothetical protein